MHKFFSCLRDPAYLNLPVCELSARLRQVGIWGSFDMLLDQKIGSQATTSRCGSQVGREAGLVRRQADVVRRQPADKQIRFADRLADSSQTSRFGSQTGCRLPADLVRRQVGRQLNPLMTRFIEWILLSMCNCCL